MLPLSGKDCLKKLSAEKLGARHTLSKPFRGEQLLGAVSESELRDYCDDIMDDEPDDSDRSSGSGY